MDLHLAPRARKMRLTIQPEDLVPTLPNPKDLMPFPQVLGLTFLGHKNMIRSLSIESSGQYLASGSDDKTVKIWEIQSGYCLKTFHVKGVVKCVSWCPNSAISLIAIGVESRVLLVNAGVGDKLIVDRTNELLKDPPAINDNYVLPEKIRTTVKWELPEKDRDPEESLVVVSHFKSVKHITWHAKGDYFSTLVPEGQNRSVFIHQLSKWRSQMPFNKSKGLVQTVLFHPSRPYFFVATQRHVRIYNLVKQELSKKLMTGSKWISSLAIHPHGDNLLVGTYDKRVQWFDLDLSTSPYQVLRYHTNAVRGVAYHKRYPLFASCSDDTSIIVSHGMVYNDLLQNPLIVPLKKLRGHTKYDDFGVMDLIWHPTQPWLFSSGADGYIRLWT
ncbi:ERB1 [Lepeophtheirus salmonis]|nr:ERB1 [Lepeophtheirus salmonis]CAF2843537.1 ERB1 [Lepeophtheirus salmonis]